MEEAKAGRTAPWRPRKVLAAVAIVAGFATAALLADAFEPRDGPQSAPVAPEVATRGTSSSTAETPPAPPGEIRFRADHPDEVREMVRFCDRASAGDRAALRRVALESPDPLCAGNALRALGRLDLVADDPRMLALAHDPRPRVRHELVRALGASRRSAAVSSLRTLLEHEDPQVRLLAIQSLGRVGGTRAGRILAEIEEGTTEPTELAFARAARREASRGDE